MVSHLRMVLLGFLVVVVGISSGAYGAISNDILKNIERINKRGPYLGIVVPNSFEMDPLLQSPSFVVDDHFPYLDVSGKYMSFSLVCHMRIQFLICFVHVFICLGGMEYSSISLGLGGVFHSYIKNKNFLDEYSL
jgi:hypothetical protein